MFPLCQALTIGDHDRGGILQFWHASRCELQVGRMQRSDTCPDVSGRDGGRKHFLINWFTWLIVNLISWKAFANRRKVIPFGPWRLAHTDTMKPIFDANYGTSCEQEAISLTATNRLPIRCQFAHSHCTSVYQTVAMTLPDGYNRSRNSFSLYWI